MAEEQLQFDIFREYGTAYSLGYKSGDEVKMVDPVIMGDITPGWKMDENIMQFECHQWQVISSTVKIYGVYYNATIKRENKE